MALLLQLHAEQLLTLWDHAWLFHKVWGVSVSGQQIMELPLHSVSCRGEEVRRLGKVSASARYNKLVDGGKR